MTQTSERYAERPKRDTKKPITALTELYDAGVQMRLDEDTNRLKASHVTTDGLTDVERARIRYHLTAFKELLKWNEAKADQLLQKMLKLVDQKIGGAVADEVLMNRVWSATDGWHDEILEAYFENDMGRLRWATRKYMEQALQAAKS